MNSIRLALTCITIFFLAALSAQNKSATDSLWAVFNNPSLPDTARLKAIHSIGQKIAFSIPDSAMIIARKEHKFASDRKLPKFEASALNTIGICYVNKGNLDSALYYYSIAREIRRKSGDNRGEAASLNNIGIIYFQRGDYTRAIEYYQRSLEIKDSIGDMPGVAASYSNIGMIYENQDNLDKALQYYEKGLHIRDSLQDIRGLADSYQKVGGIYMSRKDYDNAYFCINKSLVYAKQAEDNRTLMNAISNLGHIFAVRGNNDSALAYYQQALTLRKTTHDDQGIARSYTEIGSFYNDLHEYKEAIVYCSNGLSLADSTGFPEIQRDACNCLAGAYEATGNTDKALFYYKRAVALNDSLVGMEKSKEITRKTLQYDFEKEQLADSLRRVKESELKDVSYNQKMQQQKLYTYAGIVGFVLMVLFAFVLLRGYRNKQQTNLVLEKKNILIEEKQKAILDSITYAKRLQEAILPSLETVRQYLPNSFVLYKPKDIVAGDFYWFEHINGTSYVAAADCTGHGVPGAMVSVVCSNALNRSVLEFGITDPGKILDKTRELVLETFSKSDKDVKDGMDISLAAIKGNTVHWAGANNRLWIFQKDGVLEITPDKQPIGKTDSPKPFTTNTIELNSGDQICLLTDGYADQFGGPQGKKYKYRQLKEKLAALAKVPLDQQLDELDNEFEQWRGNLEQVDDVCIIGIRL